jgi:hypothetical protein
MLTPSSLKSTMQLTIFSIGKRRWNLLSGTETPNVAAFRNLLISRYGFATDDVPHRDLLTDALADDGTILSLVET